MFEPYRPEPYSDFRDPELRAAYRAALEAVLCVPAGAVVGYGVDVWLESGPIGVLAGLGFGFVAFILSAMQLPKRLAAVSEEEDESPSDT